MKAAVILLIGLAIFWNIFAHGSNGLFMRLNVEDGLVESSVKTILQDRYGFIWIGTAGGLNRFDGHEFITLRRSPGHSRSLTESNILSLAENPDGNLWIGTVDGLNYHDRLTDRILTVNLTPPGQSFESNRYISSLLRTESGHLWVGTADGLLRLNLDLSELIRYPTDPAGRDGPSHSAITCLMADRAGRVWIGSKQGLFVFDPLSGQFTSIHNDPELSTSLGCDSITTITQDLKGIIWIGTSHGLQYFDPHGLHFHRFDLSPEMAASAYDPILSLLCSHDNTLWVGTERGLFRIQPNRTDQSHYQHNRTDPNSLSDNVISALFEDQSGLIWSGGDKGINLLDRAKERFVHIYHDPTRIEPLSNNNVLCIFEDKGHRIWVGTDGGLDLLDTDGKRIRHYPSRPTDASTLSNPYVRAICRDTQGRIWVGTFYGDNPGLHHMDLKHGVVAFFGQSPEFKNSHIMALDADPNGTIWIATMGGGLFNFDPDRHQFVHFQADGRPNSLPDNWLYAFHRDALNTLWMATDSGTFGFDPQSGSFFPLVDPLLMNANSRTRAIVSDPEGGYWIAGEDGLSHVKPERRAFRTYSEADGLVSNLVFSVLCDSQGGIWVGTGKGISHLPRGQSRFISYDYYDGLFNNAYNVNSSHHGGSGRLYFGGKTGLNHFDPSQITCASESPPIFFTFWSRDNNRIPLSPGEKHEITISYRERQITFDFAALNFARPDKNRYAHFMEGLDPKWITHPNRHSVSYSDLRPGNYRLRIRGATACSTWAEGQPLSITVLPPFWQTWWFRLLALSLGVVLALTGYRWRLRTILRRQSELEALVTRRTEELAKKEAMYRLLIETSPDAILMTDLDGIIIMANQRAAELYGMESDMHLMGLSLFCSNTIPDPKMDALRRDLISQNMLTNQRFQISCNNGSVIPVEMNASVISKSDSHPFNIIAIIRDITKQLEIEEQLFRLASTDSLTGINNLHRFLEKAREEIKRSLRYSSPLTLLLLDIDHFKRVNDHFGHPAGDHSLKVMTKSIKNLLRQTDLFGRLGGEEFGILLIETDRKQAGEIAERLRKSLEELKIQWENQSISITMSIGLASVSPEISSWETLYQETDKVLYQAKKYGRNRVVQQANP